MDELEVFDREGVKDFIRRLVGKIINSSKLPDYDYVLYKLKGSKMNQFIADTKIVKGRLELSNIPFSDNMEVKVIVIPKVNLDKMSFLKVQRLTKSIKGNLSDDIIEERRM